jgi:hypothetical protein
MKLIILIILAVIGAVGWASFQKFLVDDKNLSLTLFSTTTPLIAGVISLIYGLIFDLLTFSTSNLLEMIKKKYIYLVVSSPLYYVCTST